MTSVETAIVLSLFTAIFREIDKNEQDIFHTGKTLSGRRQSCEKSDTKSVNKPHAQCEMILLYCGILADYLTPTYSAQTFVAEYRWFKSGGHAPDGELTANQNSFSCLVARRIES